MLPPMARTRGTGKISDLSDGMLDHMIQAQALDVYEASLLFGPAEFDFACDTLIRLLDERARRRVASPA